MFKRTNLSAFILSAILLCFSCNNNEDPNPWENLEYFDQIVVLNNVDVRLLYGSQQLVRVVGNIDASKVNIQVENEIVTISEGGVNPSMMYVEITHPAIESISVQNNGKLFFVADFTSAATKLKINVSDAGTILTPYQVTVDSLNLLLRNSARLAIDSVKLQYLDAEIMDGSRCNLQGFAANQMLKMSGGCRYNLNFSIGGWDVEQPVKGDSCWISVDNGANGWVNATEYLDASGNTGSRVFYKGDPISLEQDMKNGAKLVQKNE